MIRKFATVPGFSFVQSVVLMTILAGTATVHAQQTPAQQPAPAQQPQSQPDNQQSSGSSQEASNEDITRPAKVKVKDFTNWSYNVGGGASLTNGTTQDVCA